MNTKFRIISVILLMLFTHSFSFDGEGDGSVDSPYQITTVAQLNQVHDEIDANYILMNDLDLLGSFFYGIGAEKDIFDRAFSGVFDGKGYIIKNFVIRGFNLENYGLFARNTGIIKNLGLENVKGLFDSKKYIGALIGRMDGGKVDNCYVIGATLSGDAYVGGLIGYAENGEVTNSYSSVSLINKYGGAVAGYGGLIGDVNYMKISNSYSSSYINSTSLYYESNYVSNSIGGLIGIVDNSVVDNSFALGYIEGPKNKVGGLIGYGFDSTQITNCFTATTIMDTELGNYEGSVVGKIFENIQITNSYYGFESIGAGDETNGALLTTEGLQTVSSFVDWNINETDAIWQMETGETYPYLAGLNNAPVAIADSLVGTFADLIKNDYDPETGSDSLTMEILRIYQSGVLVEDETSVQVGDSVQVIYRVGGLREGHPTLWGGVTTSTLIIENTPPELISVIPEATVKSFGEYCVILDSVAEAIDADGDPLEVIVTTADTNVTIEYDEYLGCDVVKIADIPSGTIRTWWYGAVDLNISVKDAIYETESQKMTLIFNSGPYMIGTRLILVEKNESYTFTTENVKFNDAAGVSNFVLTVTSEDSNIVIQNNTIIPNEDFIGIVSVYLQIFDGYDYSSQQLQEISFVEASELDIINNSIQTEFALYVHENNISLQSSESGQAELKLFSVNNRNLGEHSVYLNANRKEQISISNYGKLAPGVYYVLLKQGNKSQVKAVILGD